MSSSFRLTPDSHSTYIESTDQKPFFLCFLLLFPALSFAATLDEALDKAALYFTATHVKLNPQQEFVLEVKNYRSDKKDSRAIKIESGLYLALERNFPKFKLILASESLTGISVNRAVYMKVTYDPQGDTTTLRLQATQGMNGEIGIHCTRNWVHTQVCPCKDAL